MQVAPRIEPLIDIVCTLHVQVNAVCNITTHFAFCAHGPPRFLAGETGSWSDRGSFWDGDETDETLQMRKMTLYAYFDMHATPEQLSGTRPRKSTRSCSRREKVAAITEHLHDGGVSSKFCQDMTSQLEAYG